MPVNLSNKEIRAIKEVLAKDVSFCISESGGKLWRKLERALRSIKPSSAKGKGRELQQWVCRKIAALLGIEYNQQDDQCLIHSREMGQAGVDVILRGEALRRFPFAVECKSTEQLEFMKAIKQAQAHQMVSVKNGIDKYDWMVVHKRKSLPSPVVIMSWETFEDMYKKGNY